MLDKAIALVAEKFVGKFDKGGQPYVLHCLHVMNTVRPQTELNRTIGILHDLVEDTDVDFEDLYKMGFNHEVVKGVMACTHYKNETYDDYIMRLAGNANARAVKLADLRHNSDITRMKGVREKDFERLVKYHKAYKYLQDYPGVTSGK